MILAGDIGGTKTVLALFEPHGDDAPTGPRGDVPEPGATPTFEADPRRLPRAEPPGRAPRRPASGSPGRSIDGRCQTTNLPWMLEERALAEALEVPQGQAAQRPGGGGLRDAPPQARGDARPQPGPASRRNGATSPSSPPAPAWARRCSTGTASSITRSPPKAATPTSRPRTDLEIELLRYLRAQVRRPRQLRARALRPGLLQHLRSSSATAATPPSRPMARRAAQAAATRTPRSPSSAWRATDPLCVATVDLFATIYGAEAGNLALRGVAVGGVFVGGGIAPKILPACGTGRSCRGSSPRAGSPTSCGRSTSASPSIPEPPCSARPTTRRRL